MLKLIKEEFKNVENGWSRLLLLFVSLFVIVLPFNNRYITYLIIPWSLLSLYVAFTSLSISMKDFIKHSYLFLIFYGIMLLSLIFSDDVNHGIKILETMFSLVILPFLVHVYKRHKRLEKKYTNQLINLYITGIVLYIAVSVVLLFLRWDIDRITAYFENQSLVSATSFSRLSFLQHRAYISMYVVWAIVLLLHRQCETGLPTFRVWDMLGVIVFIVYIVLLGSRAALITLFPIFIFYVWKSCRKLSVYTSSGLIIFVVGLSFFVLVEYTRLGSTFRRIQQDDIKISDNRIPLWGGAISAIEEAPFFGYGIGDGLNVLVETHKQNDLKVAYRVKANAHNQFFETMLHSGIPGILSLFVLLLIPLFSALKHRNERLFLLMTLIIINLLFESMLLRLSGVLFVGFWVSLFLYPKDHTEIDTNSHS